LIKKAGFKKKAAQTGAVTLIQRFGSALNLNIHFHMLFLEQQASRPGHEGCAGQGETLWRVLEEAPRHARFHRGQR